MDSMLREALRRERELRHQLDNLLLGEDADIWYEELRKFVAKRTCWPTLDNNIIAAIKGGRTELWVHEVQRNSRLSGRQILDHLTVTGLLASCVDLDELKAIQAQGIEFFQKHFRGRKIFGWRGVKNENVPSLIADGDKVILRWGHLKNEWDWGHPALRRK